MLIHHHSQAISPCNRIGHFLENKCRILNSLCVVSHICSPEFSLLKNKPWTDVYLLLFVFSMLSVFKIIYIFCKKKYWQNNYEEHFHRYEAGDHVGVYPINDAETVEKIGKRLGIDLDTIFTLDNIDGNWKIWNSRITKWYLLMLIILTYFDLGHMVDEMSRNINIDQKSWTLDTVTNCMKREHKNKC